MRIDALTVADCSYLIWISKDSHQLEWDWMEQTFVKASSNYSPRTKHNIFLMHLSSYLFLCYMLTWAATHQGNIYCFQLYMNRNIYPILLWFNSMGYWVPVIFMYGVVPLVFAPYWERAKAFQKKNLQLCHLTSIDFLHTGFFFNFVHI